MPINLPKNKFQSYFNKTAIISGFGYDWINVQKDGKTVVGGRSDLSMRFAMIKVTNLAECNSEYTTIFSEEKHICAKINTEYYRSLGACYVSFNFEKTILNLI